MSTYKRYNMHKYWGKKPAAGLAPLIERYSKKGDTLLDPFSGYGVFCAEGFLANRNVISNDLNPIANYLTSTLLETHISIRTVKDIWAKIQKEIEGFVKEWYTITIDGVNYEAISVLRNKSNIPIAFTYKEGNKTLTMDIPRDDADAFVTRENAFVIKDWYPTNKLITNSRISAAEGMTIADLFTRRTLACHARLMSLIIEHSTGAERDLLLLAFTANLANCSKLVPPIKSRGKLAQGAWMTGFYVGDTYIENNVLHYYKNRLQKSLSGKEEYLSLAERSRCSYNATYRITNDDAKHLNLADASIDYIFTDPPYGDSVPYFEQSIIWNSWLGFAPDYNNEIVISDSNQRSKDINDYSNGMSDSIREISRVLKPNSYFSITYHSLSGEEWKAITNACIQCNFIVEAFEWLEQATLPPRQLARKKTVKGDVLVTFRKSPNIEPMVQMTDIEFQRQLRDIIDTCIIHNTNDTNAIMMRIMEWVLRERVIIDKTDVFAYLNSNYNINSDGLWQ